MKPESSKDVWVAAVPSMNSGRREDGESLTSVTQSYQGVLSRVESGTQPVTYSWSADAQPTFPFTVICVTQGVGETLTSTDNACVHANQLPTGFVTVMLSARRARFADVGAVRQRRRVKGDGDTEDVRRRPRSRAGGGRRSDVDFWK